MATIQLEAKHSPLAWLLYLTKLQVAIDGQPATLAWGNHTFPVPPGSHAVSVSFGYLGKQRGVATSTVMADESRPAQLRYRAPIFMFSAGKMSGG